ncbi:hypothetical protein ACIBW9_15035 [Streptomyces sp. NPDC049541]|uniref:hypothetical protein n=1 Tax=Streptomyces sp. NPDC049541 TaxID=3365594 RepID=UPI0037ABAECF
MVAALGIVAFSVTGCGSSDAGGLPVRVVNESAWDAHVFGCPQCGKLGLVVVGDPDRKPGEGGAFFGWTEGRAWPTTYKVVVRGVGSVCPFIDPERGKEKGAVGTRDVIYVVDKDGKCVAGPPSLDDI